MLRVILGFFLFWSISFHYVFAIEESAHLKRVCHDVDQNTIIWDNPEDICGTHQYNIIYHRTGSTGNFEPIDTLTNTNIEDYIHSNGHEDNSEYYIASYYDCTGSQGYISDTVRADYEPPEDVVMDSVSVVNGSLVMGWTPTDEDIFGYIIYEVVDGSNFNMDTIFGRNNSQYTWEDADINNPQSLSVAAFDSCYNTGLISNPHQHMVSSAEQFPCDERIELQWNSYNGWPGGVDYYEVRASRNGTPYTLYETVDGNETNVFVDTLEDDAFYCFKIRAFAADNDFTSTSVISCDTTRFIGTPSEKYLKHVSYLDGSLDISWEISQDGNIESFNIHKGFTETDMEVIRSVPFEEEQFSYNFVDQDVNPYDTQYYYRIEIVDICEQDAGFTNSGSNMVLRGEMDEPHRMIYWNAYEDWGDGVELYEIERTSTHTDPVIWNDIAFIAGNEDLFYRDDTQIDEIGNEGICYKVRAIESGADPFGSRNQSNSNEYCFVEPPIIYIPNAFVPEGVNDIFYPVGQFIDFEQSKLRIYDRWGSRVFQTDDLRTGWDGSHEDSGEMLDGGVYMYVIDLYGLDGTIETYKGNVTLLE